MPEQLRDLLEKIKSEGIQVAEEKARQIESNAQRQAKKIIADAKDKAEMIVEEADDQAHKAKASGEAALQHAARDLMLAVKDQIRALFDKIIATNITATLTGKELSSIIGQVIDKYIKKGKQSSDVALLLNPNDLKRLKNTFIAKFKEKFKEKLEIKPTPNISAGFAISFDKGKSYYEFTDESLVECLSAYLNQELAQLLSEAIKKGKKGKK
ncbi:MAG: hypothetical protein ABH954_01475 [Candidatus Omnitrophota bacterium]